VQEAPLARLGGAQDRPLEPDRVRLGVADRRRQRVGDVKHERGDVPRGKVDAHVVDADAMVRREPHCQAQRRYAAREHGAHGDRQGSQLVAHVVCRAELAHARAKVRRTSVVRAGLSDVNDNAAGARNRNVSKPPSQVDRRAELDARHVSVEHARR